MEFRRFLDTEDAGRAARTLRKLAACDISRWALTGGLAVEIHILQHGRESGGRQLRDMDFVAGSFEDIPAALGSEVLFRHVHPYDEPAKTMLQCVDEETALRVDLLRAYGQEMERAVPVRAGGDRAEDDLELRMWRRHMRGGVGAGDGQEGGSANMRGIFCGCCRW